MPSREQHEFQAKHNQKLLDFLEISNKRDYFRDWYVTIAFYTALHHFEGILHVVSPAVNKARGRMTIYMDVDYYDHDKRMIVMRDEVFSGIYRPYLALYSFSRLAKYNLYGQGLDRPDPDRGRERDAEAIAEAWRRVGDCLRYAMGQAVRHE